MYHSEALQKATLVLVPLSTLIYLEKSEVKSFKSFCSLLIIPTSFSLNTAPKWKSKTKQVSLAPKFTKHLKKNNPRNKIPSRIISRTFSHPNFLKERHCHTDGGNGTNLLGEDEEQMQEETSSLLSESSLEFSFYLSTPLHLLPQYTIALLRAAV